MCWLNVAVAQAAGVRDALPLVDGLRPAVPASADEHARFGAHRGGLIPLPRVATGVVQSTTRCGHGRLCSPVVVAPNCPPGLTIGPLPHRPVMSPNATTRAPTAACGGFIFISFLPCAASNFPGLSSAVQHVMFLILRPVPPFALLHWTMRGTLYKRLQAYG